MIQTLGVPLRAEMIPSKPDADNAAEGKRNFLFLRHSWSSTKIKGMEIKLNNQIKTFPDRFTVQNLVDEIIAEKQKGIAVAVNSCVIPKSNWEEHFLNSKDEVLIIKATQGG